jgi:probable F420-dependent oxidoreductase
MKIGVVFPQTEIGEDPGGVREYAQAAEDLGYSHILAYDHVVGADTRSRPGWRGPYDIDSLFHEPLVLFGYLAGLTSQIGFITGILILPQRQTALVAKQAAEVDVLSGGRFRLGVGIGWNPVEYQALNEDFHNRGRREEEQIVVLRQLFAERVVTFQGKWHHLDAVGINPIPVQRPIPIWLGGSPDTVLPRVARLGDGWLPQQPPDAATREALRRLREFAVEAGRDPASIGIEGRISIAGKTPDQWAAEVAAWRELGATHISVNTMRAGLNMPQSHIDAIRTFRQAVNW